MGNTKVYIHEFIDIIGQNRAAYMEHTTSWGAIGRRERNMVCFGVWATVGSTERWPEVVNLWELDGWPGLAANFRHEFSHATHQDPSLAEWWATAASYRRGGFDRILVPAHYSPTAAEAVATGLGGDVYYHELIQVQPGRARDYLAMLEQEWLAEAARIGLGLVGAYRSGMVNDSEVVVIWSMDTWESWAQVEEAYENDPAVARWRSRSGSIVADWRSKLLVAAPASPLATGYLL